MRTSSPGPPSPLHVWDLPRNDLDACYRYWVEREITADEWRVMLRLQDDSTALIAASKHWVRALAR